MVASSDGISLHAEVHGDGIPVLFSCALNTTQENWRPQVGPLVEAGFRVVLWDYRGHGRSEVPLDAAAYSMQRVVADMGSVLDWAAPGEPAVLAGLSFGGLASLHFTLQAPQRVRALVLVDSGPGFKNPDAQANWQDSVEKTAGYLERKGMEPFVASRAVSMLVGTESERPEARAALRAIAAQEPRGLANFGRYIAGPAPGVIDDLPKIDVPALVLVGEHDKAYLRAAEVMEAKLPHAQRVVIPGAHHIVNLEQPKAFESAVLRFLGQVRDAGVEAGEVGSPG